MKAQKSLISVITIMALAVTLCICPPVADKAYAIDANPDDNKLIAPTTVTAGKSFKITLKGSNQNLTSPADGDTRYIPVWYVIHDANGRGVAYGNPPEPSYTVTCKINKAGTYTLTGQYLLEIYCETYLGQPVFNWSDPGGDIPPLEGLVEIEQTIKVISKYKITLNGNKGKIGKKKSVKKTVTYGKKYGKLPKPNRKNYMFLGWYTKKTGGTKITASTEVTKQSKHTLYARWLGPKGKGKSITTKEYNRIKKNMTYKQVKFLIGGSPYYQDTTYNDDETWTTRAWYGNKKKWEAIILWKNNKVVSKTKVTL